MRPFNRLSVAALLLVSIAAILYSCEKLNTSPSSFGLASDYIANGSVGNVDSIVENSFIKTIDSATSTFSVDADGGSYALARRLLTYEQQYLSNYKAALRTEEFINYFTYNYPDPTGGAPIGVNGEVSSCPWNAGHKLIRIGIKGKSVPKQDYPTANFVLLIDVSGSMGSDDKLKLLREGFIDFVKQMRAQDRIAIVVYAGSQGVALESTPGTQKDKIIKALEKLGAGGSTNGAAGITKAYEIAEQNFIPGGNNRIILGTDGDFNVGISSTEELVKLVEEKREKGVYFTSLGVGAGNLNESMLEKIANNGNGNYEYLDSHAELQKVFVEEYNKFLTVAKDVKVQVTFNPALVEEYRLIGYENRVMKNSEFADDKKDAGEVGAGQTITAIYEIKPTVNVPFRAVPTFTINFRYKKPAENTSIPLDLDIYDEGHSFPEASEDLRFAGSLAGLALYLRGSAYKGSVTLAQIKQWADGARTFDPNGYRARHMELLKKVQ